MFLPILLLGTIVRSFISFSGERTRERPEFETPISSYLRFYETSFLLEMSGDTGGVQDGSSLQKTSNAFSVQTSSADDDASVIYSKYNNFNHVPPLLFYPLHKLFRQFGEIGYWFLLLMVDFCIMWLLYRFVIIKNSFLEEEYAGREVVMTVKSDDGTAVENDREKEKVSLFSGEYLLGKLYVPIAEPKESKDILKNSFQGNWTGKQGSVKLMLAPTTVCLSYFLNPWVINSHAILSMQNIHVLSVLMVIYFALKGAPTRVGIALAWALYIIPFTPIVLLLPASAMCYAVIMSERLKKQADKEKKAGRQLEDKRISMSNTYVDTEDRTLTQTLVKDMKSATNSLGLVTSSTSTAGSPTSTAGSSGFKKISTFVNSRIKPELLYISGVDGNQLRDKLIQKLKKMKDKITSTAVKNIKKDINTSSKVVKDIYPDRWITNRFLLITKVLIRIMPVLQLMVYILIVTGIAISTFFFFSFWISNRNWDWFYSCYLIVIQFDDLTPTLSIWWYIFTEMFPRFKLLFLTIFHCHVLVYGLPIHMILGDQLEPDAKGRQKIDCFGPFAALVCGYGFIALWRPYPTVIDFSVLISFYCVFGDQVLPVSQTYRRRVRRFILSRDANYVPIEIEYVPSAVNSDTVVNSVTVNSAVTVNSNTVNSVTCDTSTNTSKNTSTNTSSSSSKVNSSSTVKDTSDTTSSSTKSKSSSPNHNSPKVATNSAKKSIPETDEKNEEKNENMNENIGGDKLATLTDENKPKTSPRKKMVIWIMTAFFGLCMFPVMSELWLMRNSGNANFLFFMGMTYQVGAILSLFEFVRLTVTEKWKWYGMSYVI